MTRHFCDICGKEIHPVQTRYTVEVTSEEADSGSNSYYVHKPEVCLDCAHRIHRTVHDLERSGAKTESPSEPADMKKLTEAFNIVVRYGFCCDCDRVYNSPGRQACDCYENGVKLIRQAMGLEGADNV